MVYGLPLLILATWQMNNLASCMGTMATSDTASLETGVTISLASSTMDNISMTTMSKYDLRTVSLAQSYRKSVHNRKRKKPQGRRKPPFRSLDPPDSCLRWSPDLNVTADPSFGSLTVDYCLSEQLPVPNTHTCARNAETAWCTVVESPRCGHVFENLTAGNYTIMVKPLCKSCFDVEIYDTECITPIYTKLVKLEMTGDNFSVEKKQSYSAHTEVIVPASCAGILLLVILVVAYVMAKNRLCTESFSCGGCNISTNQSFPNLLGQHAGDDQPNTEMSQDLPFYNLEQKTVFSENSTETDAMLSDAHRLSQEQPLLDPEDQSYPCHYTDINPSVIPLNRKVNRLINSPSCRTINTSSDEICDTPARKDQEYQMLQAAVDFPETLQSYFDSDTGITYTPTTSLAIPRIVDIPFHLINEDNIQI